MFKERSHPRNIKVLGEATCAELEATEDSREDLAERTNRGVYTKQLILSVAEIASY